MAGPARCRPGLHHRLLPLALHPVVFVLFQQLDLPQKVFRFPGRQLHARQRHRRLLSHEVHPRPEVDRPDVLDLQIRQRIGLLRVLVSASPGRLAGRRELVLRVAFPTSGAPGEIRVVPKEPDVGSQFFISFSRCFSVAIRASEYLPTISPTVWSSRRPIRLFSNFTSAPASSLTPSQPIRAIFRSS